MIKLLEGLPKISEQAINEAIYSCVECLNNLGDEFAITKNDFELDLNFETTGLQGCTALFIRKMPDGYIPIQKVSFNSNMFREGLEDLYINTIYHELVHVLAHKYFIEHNIIKISPEDGKVTIIDSETFKATEANNGHGGVWKFLIDKLNPILKLKIPLTAYCSDEDADRVFNASVDEYNNTPAVEFRCIDCGFSKKFLTVNFKELPNNFGLLEAYFDGKNGFKNHFCKKCLGTLYFIVNDPELTRKLEEKLEIYEAALMLKKMFS